MKKLMLAATIVCVAAMSQAATTKWSASTGDNFIYLPGQTTKTVGAGTAYIFCSYTADTSDLAKAAVVSQQDVIDAFLKGDDISKLHKQAAVEVGSTGAIASQQFTTDDFATGKQTKMFMALVVDDEIYISALQTKTSNGTSPQALLYSTTGSSQKALNTTGTYSAAGWYGAVPEPTSGLLLLLGVAGLALKRKRA